MRGSLVLVAVLSFAVTPARAQEPPPAVLGPGASGEYARGAGSLPRGPTVTVRIGRAMHVTGPLRRGAARSVLQRHVNEIVYCYDRGLVENPNLPLTATVVLRIAILQTGAVAAAERMSSTLLSNGIENCIVAAARRWTFPPVDGLVMVDVPYDFIAHGRPRPAHIDTFGGAD